MTRLASKEEEDEEDEEGRRGLVCDLERKRLQTNEAKAKSVRRLNALARHPSLAINRLIASINPPHHQRSREPPQVPNYARTSRQ